MPRITLSGRFRLRSTSKARRSAPFVENNGCIAAVDPRKAHSGTGTRLRFGVALSGTMHGAVNIDARREIQPDAGEIGSAHRDACLRGALLFTSSLGRADTI